MPKKILVVLTTTEKYPNLNRATGVWLGEAVHFVERVERAGFVVDYVSPTGGYTPIDPHSLAMAEPIDWEWYHNRKFMDRLGATLKPVLSWITCHPPEAIHRLIPTVWPWRSPSIGSGTTIANLWTVSARRSNPLT